MMQHSTSNSATAAAAAVTSSTTTTPGQIGGGGGGIGGATTWAKTWNGDDEVADFSGPTTATVVVGGVPPHWQKPSAAQTIGVSSYAAAGISGQLQPMTADTATAKGGNSWSARSILSPFQSIFDVSTSQVIHRIQIVYMMGAPGVSFWQTFTDPVNALSTALPNTDFYGPLWISMTLWIAFSAACVFTTLPAVYSASSEGANLLWSYTASGLLLSIWMSVSFIVFMGYPRFLLKTDIFPQMTKIVTMIGYSMSAYLLMPFVGMILLSFMSRWIAVFPLLCAVGLQVWFLFRSFDQEILSYIEQTKQPIIPFNNKYVFWAIVSIQQIIFGLFSLQLYHCAAAPLKEEQQLLKAAEPPVVYPHDDAVTNAAAAAAYTQVAAAAAAAATGASSLLSDGSNSSTLAAAAAAGVALIIPSLVAP